MGLGLHIIDQFRKSPENNEDGPELGDDVPGVNVWVEVLVKKYDSDGNQCQRPENRTSTVCVNAHVVLPARAAGAPDFKSAALAERAGAGWNPKVSAPRRSPAGPAMSFRCPTRG